MAQIAPGPGILRPLLPICEGGQPPSYGSMTFSGLLVFHAAAADGFAELGRVAHPPTAGIDCSNWWSDAASQVRRSVFMDDYVYSISGSTVKVNALANLATDLVTIPISNWARARARLVRGSSAARPRHYTLTRATPPSRAAYTRRAENLRRRCRCKTRREVAF